MTRFLFIIFLCLLFSCNDRSEKRLYQNTQLQLTEKQEDSFRYQIFTVGNNGFGFDIIKNEKVYIHQPFIPSWTGIHLFPTKESADSIARLTAKKLKNDGYYTLIEISEVDSIMKTFSKELKNHIDSNSDISLIDHFEKPVSTSTSTAHTLLFNELPLLPEMPLKSRWLSKGVVPFGHRSATLSFVIGADVYIGAGEYKDKAISDFWKYNTETEAWTCLAEVPGARVSSIAFSLDNKGYAGMGAERGGTSATFKKDFYEYLPDRNSWIRKSDYPGNGRVDMSSFVINNEGYVGLGYGDYYCNDFYKYDHLKDLWIKLPNFVGGPVSAALGVNTGNKGFIICGDRVPEIENKRFVYQYLPDSNQWVEKRDFPSARYFMNGWGLDSNLLLAGCGAAEGGERRFRDFYLFNADLNEWKRVPDYPIEKIGNSRLGGGSVNGNIYMGTGYNGSFLNNWNVFQYYFTVKRDTGSYNETVSYPLNYKGIWELYQECTHDNCFAGIEIKTNENLGSFSYSRYFSKLRNMNIAQKTALSKTVYIFPRNFYIQTEIQPEKEVELRFLYSRKEIEDAFKDCFDKTGIRFSLEDLQVMQYNGKSSDTNTFSNSFEAKNSTYIHPRLYQYGFNAETIVAEISVTSLSSTFYLALPVQ